MGRGTEGYAAPEIFGLGHAHKNASYTFLVDMWSLGAVLYKNLTYQVAFQSLTRLHRYAKEEIDFPRGPLEANKISSLAVDIILTLMSPRPDTWPAAASAKVHPWFEMSSSLEESISLDALQ
ncbi:ser/thr/tyr protein kinase RAD53 [Microdochium nivale]|nr:ser/thr/tyr protein kinase RAD53 [Microdochium nivale]